MTRALNVPGALALVAAMLAGCTQGSAPSPASQAAAMRTSADEPTLAQSEICIAEGQRVESGCKAGQRVLFLPPRWGNEQLPVIFASMNCDLRYQVVMTNGGVVCIFMKARVPEPTGNAERSSEPTTAPSAPPGK